MRIMSASESKSGETRHLTSSRRPTRLLYRRDHTKISKEPDQRRLFESAKRIRNDTFALKYSKLNQLIVISAWVAYVGTYSLSLGFLLSAECQVLIVADWPSRRVSICVCNLGHQRQKGLPADSGLLSS